MNKMNNKEELSLSLQKQSCARCGKLISKRGKRMHDMSCKKTNSSSAKETLTPMLESAKKSHQGHTHLKSSHRRVF